MAATFGTVVPIGGQASDLALDEARGLVYIANFTANRIDVVSTAGTLLKGSSMSVAHQPSSLSLSPDGRYLVVTHLSNFQPPSTVAPYYGITIIDLVQKTNRTYAYTSAPMGVAFGSDGQALLVTTTDFLLLNPATGATRSLAAAVDVITPKPLPVVTPTPPREIVRASMSASGDLKTIWGTIEVEGAENTQLILRYDVPSQTLYPAIWISTPILGPRVVSVSQDGTSVLTGWGLYKVQGFLLAEFPDPLGKFGVGSHAIDSTRNLVYAQIPHSSWTTTTPPVLQVLDADNLTVREQLKLKENLAGRSVLNSTADTMYSVSDSGLMILPVGSLSKTPQVVTAQEDVVFRGQWCNRGVLVQTLNISDPSGNKTDFSLSPAQNGVTVSPASGTTPATVQVSIDMGQFLGNLGTSSSLINISSNAAVNIVPPVRVLVNNRQPDQRGTFFDVPGQLVDMLADPKRNRFYVLRQDKNQVLVFDGNNYTQIGTLRTGNTPWSMAMTPDQKYLMIGADNSQVAHVYNLDTLAFKGYIVLPFGHYPRWIASSSNAILAASRVAGSDHTIDEILFNQGTGTELPSLGVWKTASISTRR